MLLFTPVYVEILLFWMILSVCAFRLNVLISVVTIKKSTEQASNATLA